MSGVSFFCCFFGGGFIHLHSIEINYICIGTKTQKAYNAAAPLAEIIPLQGGRVGSGQETRRGYSTDHSRAHGYILGSKTFGCASLWIKSNLVEMFSVRSSSPHAV